MGASSVWSMLLDRKSRAAGQSAKADLDEGQGDKGRERATQPAAHDESKHQEQRGCDDVFHACPYGRPRIVNLSRVDVAVDIRSC